MVKSGWRLISTTNFWTKVILQKYISPSSLIDWIQNPQKSFRGGSIFWKAIVKSFHLISEGLAWRVGDGCPVILGLDPWSRSGINHLLPPHIQEFVGLQGYSHLDQIVDPDTTTIWRQGWLFGVSLGLPELDYPEWDRYQQTLGESHIRLQDQLDELIWDGNPTEHYLPKVGYV